MTPKYLINPYKYGTYQWTTMLACTEESCVVIEMLNYVCTKQGSIYLGNKRKTSRGMHPFLWSQFPNHAMIALTNQPY